MVCISNPTLKYCILLCFPAIVFLGCNRDFKKPTPVNGIQKYTPPRIVPKEDTDLASNLSGKAIPKTKRLVVGYKELGIYFHNWPANFRLDFAGAPLADDNSTAPIQLRIYTDALEHILTLRAELWTHVRSPAIGESAYKVGEINAYRSVDPKGNLEYTFETDLAIVNVSNLKPAYENWFTTNFSANINKETDSLVLLAWSPFPLQLPQDEQRIGISFPTQKYHDGGFQHTKVWLSLTNFSSHETNSKLIADVIGTIENLTDGKPTLKEGEELVLKNFYAGISKRWTLAHEGDKLILYESIRDEPSPGTHLNITGDKKAILVLPIPKELKFSFRGYAPMGE